jgi:hypothetical protein
MEPKEPFAEYPRSAPKVERPWWVKLTLIGLSSRRAVVACGWFSIALAAVSAVAGFFQYRFFLGILIAAAAFPYFATVMWMDQHDDWPIPQKR